MDKLYFNGHITVLDGFYLYPRGSSGKSWWWINQYIRMMHERQQLLYNHLDILLKNNKYPRIEIIYDISNNK